MTRMRERERTFPTKHIAGVEMSEIREVVARKTQQNPFAYRSCDGIEGRTTEGEGAPAAVRLTQGRGLLNFV